MIITIIQNPVTITLSVLIQFENCKMLMCINVLETEIKVIMLLLLQITVISVEQWVVWMPFSLLPKKKVYFV